VRDRVPGGREGGTEGERGECGRQGGRQECHSDGLNAPTLHLSGRAGGRAGGRTHLGQVGVVQRLVNRDAPVGIKDKHPLQQIEGPGTRPWENGRKRARRLGRERGEIAPERP